MKKTFTQLMMIFLLLTGGGKSIAQPYESIFGTTSTSWDIILEGYCDAVCSGTFAVTGDTTIGTFIYKVLPSYPGFLREDTLSGKVWYFSKQYNTEYLVMDLSLALGDTFWFYDWQNIPEPAVVDSVYYVLGKKQIRVTGFTNICGYQEIITFKEGTGPTAGFNYPRTMGGNWVYSYMLCQHKDGIKTAGNLLWSDTCYVCSVGLPDLLLNSANIKIYPNPAKEEITIEIEEKVLSNCNFTLYNLLGDEVLKQELNLKSNKIPLNAIYRGVYIAKIYNGTSMHQEKIIIN